jgi:glycosyltransferase involved in cell wall biosynthesis
VGTLSPANPPPGFLRLFVVFHESEALGAGRSVLNALGPLRAYGWTPSAWFPGDGPLVDAAASELAAYASRSKPIRYSLRGWNAGPGVVSRVRDLPEYLRAFRRALLAARPHVVHANTLRTLPEARIARKLGLPVVLHIHELPPPSVKRTLALRSAATIADVLVVVSGAVADVVERHARTTPVLVAHNGVPVRSDGLRVALPDSPTIGTIGTACRTKGTDVFLEAAVLARSRRPELRFEHVGARELDDDLEFAEHIAALEARPQVHDAVGFLGPRDASAELARWELFVLASRQDAFPLAILEAMAAGVPVLATDVGGVREQIEHLENGVLVEPENVEALASWIVRLHDDPDLRAKLAAAATARLRDRFTTERQAAVLHKAYLAALNLRHGPPPVRRRTLELV